tara:strand:- start:437 stop:1729 length:1293 start_codon:yes stop_codon:yes gene_type:complete
MNQITSEGDKLVIIGTINMGGTILNNKNFAFTIEGLDASSTFEGNGGTSRFFTINGATSANVTFKNLTFSGNNTTLAGGAVLFSNNGGATATFENCTFSGNSVTNNAGGGAIYSSNGSLTITGCVFENNTSSDKGGAIVAGNSVNVNISGSLFNGNSATRGGAIAVTGNGVDFILDTSTFVNNTVSSNGGGALYLGGNNANSSITNTTIFNNSVTYTSLNQSTGGGIRIEGARPFTITNSLIYGNIVSDGNGTAASDIGGPTALELTLNNSLTRKIEPVLVSVGDGGNDVFSTSITDANLSASNLTFNATSGYVEYNTVDQGVDSPIDFGSDGKDVGAWDSEFTLSLDKDELLANKLSVYFNASSKNIEVLHTINEPVSLQIYTILGVKVLTANNVVNKQVISANTLKTGIYVLVGKTSNKFFSKKFLIN